MRFPIEEFVGHYTLKILRMLTSCHIFKEIAKNYCDSLPLVYRNVGDDWVFIEGDLKEAVSVSNGLLTCTCGYLEKTGIPCCHLHKIIEETRDNVASYVHSRWKIVENRQEESKVCVKIKKGRPKRSRRNRI